MNDNLLGNENVRTVDQVLNVFDAFRKPSRIGIDQYDLTGRKILGDRVMNRVSQNKPIIFVFPGFPAKSTNVRDKVLGTLPDKAEELAFRTIDRFLTATEDAYRPGGAEFHVISDGHVFGDVVGISRERIESYEAATKEMIGPKKVNWHNLSTFYNDGCFDSKRTRLVEQFGISGQELDDRIRNRPDINMLYCGMLRFMQEEIMWREEFPSRKALEKASKPITRAMMLRNEAYSNLIDALFPQAIRLSIHPSTNSGHKYSFNLVQGDDGWASPWHNVAVLRKDGQSKLMKRKLAEEQGYEVVTERGRPYFFTEK